MNKTLLVAICGLLIANTAFGQLSKNDKQKLKNELKAYMSDLEGYKSKKDDLQMTLDSNEAQIKRLKDELAYTAMNQTEMQNKVAAYEKEVSKLRTENEELKSWNDSTVTAAAENAMAATPGAAAVSEKGTVFKIQVGNYKNFSLTKYFSTPRTIGYEDYNGTTRYVIGGFTDRKVAFNFLEDIKRLGISDAFVAKYIDGKRVEGWGSGQ